VRARAGSSRLRDADGQQVDGERQDARVDEVGERELEEASALEIAVRWVALALREGWDDEGEDGVGEADDGGGDERDQETDDSRVAVLLRELSAVGLQPRAERRSGDHEAGREESGWVSVRVAEGADG
jgi:hypothetical protein